MRRNPHGRLGRQETGHSAGNDARGVYEMIVLRMVREELKLMNYEEDERK
jgi:hypothetical protein